MSLTGIDFNKFLIRLEDGYWYFDPSKMSGCCNDFFLREIAEYIKIKNKSWDDQVRRDIAED